MTETIDTGRASTPWHFWVVAVLSVLWNAIGAIDYTMSHVQPEQWFATMGMTEAQTAFYNSYPSWMHAVWAIGVWGGAVGAILLILRMKWALHAFVLSFLGALGNVAYTAATPGAMEAMGLTMPLIILVICLFLIWYAWTMSKRGVLR